MSSATSNTRRLILTSIFIGGFDSAGLYLYINNSGMFEGFYIINAIGVFIAIFISGLIAFDSYFRLNSKGNN